MYQQVDRRIANDDNIVNALDVLELLQNWGTFSVGAAIAEPENVIDLLDLLDLLAAWGDC